MSSSIDSFIDKWLYDIDHTLRIQLEALRDQLDSQDQHTREYAANQVREILDWLYQPPGPLPDDEKWRRTRDALHDESKSLKERLAAARRVARSTGRPRGRPRTDTAQHAIRALSLHLATDLSWRKIALIVKGCEHYPQGRKHYRPNPKELSCIACGDAIRDAVGRLEKFLRTKGYHPEFPRRVDLDRMSHADFKRLFGPLTDSDK